MADAAAVHGYTTAFWWSVGIFVLGFVLAMVILPGRSHHRVPSARAALARFAIGNCHHFEARHRARHLGARPHAVLVDPVGQLLQLAGVGELRESLLDGAEVVRHALHAAKHQRQPLLERALQGRVGHTSMLGSREAKSGDLLGEQEHVAEQAGEEDVQDGHQQYRHRPAKI